MGRVRDAQNERRILQLSADGKGMYACDRTRGRDFAEFCQQNRSAGEGAPSWQAAWVVEAVYPIA